MRTALLIAFVVASAPVQELAFPDGGEPTVSVAGRGVQVYACTKGAWTLVGPEAALFDGAGKQVGTHSAGPTWTWNDGSAITGKVVRRQDSSDPANVPWLLLSAEQKQAGHGGVLSAVRWVRRSETHGGAAPVTGCDASATVRVPYTAVYAFR